MSCEKNAAGYVYRKSHRADWTTAGAPPPRPFPGCCGPKSRATIACATSTVRVPSAPVLRYTGRSPASACTPSSSSLTAPLLPASATSIPRHSRVQPAPVGIQPSKPRIVGTRPVLVSVGFVGPLASWGVWALTPLPRRSILVIPLPLHYLLVDRNQPIVAVSVRRAGVPAQQGPPFELGGLATTQGGGHWE